MAVDGVVGVEDRHRPRRAASRSGHVLCDVFLALAELRLFGAGGHPHRLGPRHDKWRALHAHERAEGGQLGWFRGLCGGAAGGLGRYAGHEPCVHLCKLAERRRLRRHEFR